MHGASSQSGVNIICETCPVRDRAACSVLNPEERHELAAMGRTRQLKRGETLFAAGDEEAACATLQSGALKVTTYDEDGEERILALIHPAGFAGELFQPFAHYDVVALSDSRVCTFARRDFEAAVSRFPALGMALLRRSQDDLHAARDLLALTSRKEAKTRVAALILALAQAASDSPCHPARRFELPLTRGEIANLAGLTIETVSRRMTQLESDGIIQREGARGIVLQDANRLAELAGVEA